MIYIVTQQQKQTNKSISVKNLILIFVKFTFKGIIGVPVSSHPNA